MTKATTLTGGELLPIVQNGTNMVTTVTLLRKDLVTEEWVQNAINNAGGKTVVVTELPAKGDANKIYLVPNGSSKADDVYDEYIWLGDEWEFLGNKQITIDLTPYYTKTETDDKFVVAVTGKQLSTNDYTDADKQEVAKIVNKVDKVNNKQLSTEDFTTDFKTKLSEGYTKDQIDAQLASLITRIEALEVPLTLLP